MAEMGDLIREVARAAEAFVEAREESDWAGNEADECDYAERRTYIAMAEAEQEHVDEMELALVEAVHALWKARKWGWV